MPQTPAFTRKYILLTPAGCRASGHARLEYQRSRAAITIHAVSLPQGPLRALLLSGDEHTGAVLDLGPMHALSPDRHALCCSDLQLRGCWHTLVIVSDWPAAQVLLWGQILPSAHCTLWQAQKAAKRYLSVPAPDAPAPPVRSSVLRLPVRLST